MTTTTLPDAETLATEFTIVIREWLNPATLATIDSRNAAELDPHICHSHDFCDPNQAMIDAFARFNVELDPHNEEHVNLMDEAWDIAKRIRFGTYA
jgi:hypothetical protein